MANKDKAVERIMREEDSREAGAVTVDRGGRTRFGIAERFHPQLTETGFFDAMEHDMALQVAEETLVDEYWKPISGDGITSQRVATLLFSMAVNEGVREAVTLLQRALKVCGHGQIIEDGKMGVNTLTATNSVNEDLLIQFLKAYAKEFYNHIAATQPGQQKYLAGWLNRIDDASRG